MSPTIRVDDEVLEGLKRHAEPFVDTPNSVLRRMLGLPRKAAEEEGLLSSKPVPPRAKRRGSRKGVGRAERGTMLSEEEYDLPILAILNQNGGRVPTRELIETLGTWLAGRLTHTDRQALKSGGIRWRNRAQFVRLRLIEQGDMKRGSPRGIWEITDQGSRRLQGVSIPKLSGGEMNTVIEASHR
jgi:hypothetical protein